MTLHKVPWLVSWLSTFFGVDALHLQVSFCSLPMAACWAEAKAGLPPRPGSILLFLPQRGPLHLLMVHNPSHTGFCLCGLPHRAAPTAPTWTKARYWFCVISHGCVPCVEMHPTVHWRPASSPATTSVLPRPVALKAAMQAMARTRPHSGGGRSTSLCCFSSCRPWLPRALSLCVCLTSSILRLKKSKAGWTGRQGEGQKGWCWGDKCAGVLSSGSLGAPGSRAGLGALLST